MSSRSPLLALFLGCICSGCQFIPLPVPAAFNPAQGPVADQTPRPTFVGQFTVLLGQLNGPVTVKLMDGETFTGNWQTIGALSNPTVSSPGAAPPPDLSAEWDFIYGSGYFRAHVLGADYYVRALLTGSAGGMLAIEIANDYSNCGDMRGVARDSHQNVYKVSTAFNCLQRASAVDFGVVSPAVPGPQNAGPTLVIPATGGPPVIAIPAGGIYVPVTGGAPITGTPIP